MSLPTAPVVGDRPVHPCTKTRLPNRVAWESGAVPRGSWSDVMISFLAIPTIPMPSIAIWCRPRPHLTDLGSGTSDLCHLTARRTRLSNPTVGRFSGVNANHYRPGCTLDMPVLSLPVQVQPVLASTKLIPVLPTASVKSARHVLKSVHDIALTALEQIQYQCRRRLTAIRWLPMVPRPHGLGIPTEHTFTDRGRGIVHAGHRCPQA